MLHGVLPLASAEDLLILSILPLHLFKPRQLGEKDFSWNILLLFHGLIEHVFNSAMDYVRL